MGQQTGTDILNRHRSFLRFFSTVQPKPRAFPMERGRSTAADPLKTGNAASRRYPRTSFPLWVGFAPCLAAGWRSIGPILCISALSG